MQVQFPPQLSTEAGTAEGDFMEVVRSCLVGKPQHRPSAKQVEARLQAIIEREGWSNNLLDTDEFDEPQP